MRQLAVQEGQQARALHSSHTQLDAGISGVAIIAACAGLGP